LHAQRTDGYMKPGGGGRDLAATTDSTCAAFAETKPPCCWRAPVSPDLQGDVRAGREVSAHVCSQTKKKEKEAEREFLGQPGQRSNFGDSQHNNLDQTDKFALAKITWSP